MMTTKTMLVASSIRLLSRGPRLVAGEVEEACAIASTRRIQTHLEPRVRKVSATKTAIAAEVEVIVVDAAIEEVEAEAKTMGGGTEVKLLGTVATMGDIIVVTTEVIVAKADTKAGAAVIATATKAEAGAIAATTPAEVTITTVAVDAAEDTPDLPVTLSPMPREKSSTSRNNSSNNRLELINS